MAFTFLCLSLAVRTIDRPGNALKTRWVLRAINSVKSPKCTSIQLCNDRFFSLASHYQGEVANLLYCIAERSGRTSDIEMLYFDW